MTKYPRIAGPIGGALLCLLFLLLAIYACSRPSSEGPIVDVVDPDPNCSAARLAVKKSYALTIFGNADYPEPSNATWAAGAFMTSDLMQMRTSNPDYLFGGEKRSTSRYEVLECMVRTEKTITVRLRLYFEPGEKDLSTEVLRTSEGWKLTRVAPL